MTSACPVEVETECKKKIYDGIQKIYVEIRRYMRIYRSEKPIYIQYFDADVKNKNI